MLQEKALLIKLQCTHSVPDEAFRGPEVQFFEAPIFSIKTNVAWCPQNTRVHLAK